MIAFKRTPTPSVQVSTVSSGWLPRSPQADIADARFQKGYERVARR
jgi:hypothetical protein